VIRQQEALAADIRVLTMPPGRDPDEVIREEPERWPHLVHNAKPVLDYLFGAIAARHDMTVPRERAAAAELRRWSRRCLADRTHQAFGAHRIG
jgi:DNA primase